MSFETIRIQRRQPVLDKQYIKVPGAEPGAYPTSAQPLLPANEAVDGLNSTGESGCGYLQFGRGKKNEFLSQYHDNINLDFITYEEVGLDGKVIGEEDEPVRDFQEELRQISSDRGLYPDKQVYRG